MSFLGLKWLLSTRMSDTSELKQICWGSTTAITILIDNFQTATQVPGRTTRWSDPGKRLWRKLSDLRLGETWWSVSQHSGEVWCLHFCTLVRLLVQDPHLPWLVVHHSHISHVWVFGVLPGTPAAKFFRVLVGSLDSGCCYLQWRWNGSWTFDLKVSVDENIQLERTLYHSNVQRKNQENNCTIQVTFDAFILSLSESMA